MKIYPEAVWWWRRLLSGVGFGGVHCRRSAAISVDDGQGHAINLSDVLFLEYGK